MAVTEQDVRHVADLARVGVPADRLPQLVAELNGILAHMDVLERVDTTGVAFAAGVSSGGMPLREDVGPAYPLAAPRESFAPTTRDGFLLVPRLATHAALIAASGDPTADAEAEEEL